MVSHLENNLQMVGFPHLVDRRVQRPHSDLTGIMVRDNYIIASNYPPILSYFIFIHSKSPSNHGNYPNLSEFSVPPAPFFTRTMPWSLTSLQRAGAVCVRHGWRRCLLLYSDRSPALELVQRSLQAPWAMFWGGFVSHRLANRWLINNG